jgi:hypothetical protein
MISRAIVFLLLSCAIGWMHVPLRMTEHGSLYIYASVGDEDELIPFELNIGSWSGSNSVGGSISEDP